MDDSGRAQRHGNDLLKANSKIPLAWRGLCIASVFVASINHLLVLFHVGNEGCSSISQLFLDGGLEHFLFSRILGIIIPTD